MPDSLETFHLVSGMEGKQLLGGENGARGVVSPKLGDWRETLTRSFVVGKPGEYKPLVLDDRSRLYLYRYWDYQQNLVNFIRGRVSEGNEDINVTILKDGLDRLFGKGSRLPASKTCTACPADQAEDIDWQKVAAFTSLIKRFCIISGGPGTGKTTTVAKILTLVLEQPNPRNLRIALAAPTGKAAARLEEAIRGSKEKLNCPESIKEAIPEEASTIHRLLGNVPGSPYFRHEAQNKLPVDVVVVERKRKSGRTRCSPLSCQPARQLPFHGGLGP